MRVKIKRNREGTKEVKDIHWIESPSCDGYHEEKNKFQVGV